MQETINFAVQSGAIYKERDISGELILDLSNFDIDNYTSLVVEFVKDKLAAQFTQSYVEYFGKEIYDTIWDTEV